MDTGHAVKRMLLWRPVGVEPSFGICPLFVIRTAALLCCSTAQLLIGALIVAVPCAPALIFCS